MARAERPRLRFRSDGSFVIVQVTDVHWHNGEPEDERSRALMESVLDAEGPDLVALTGDIVGGYASADPAEALRRVVAPIITRGVPWAMVFGNHDDEGPLSREGLLGVQETLPLCLTERGPRALPGVGNYVLRVLPSDGEGLGAALYFLDSGGYSDAGFGTYAWIAPEQIAWYRRQARALAVEFAAQPPEVARAERLPALAFFHLPLPEYAEVWDLEPCRGSKNEPVCCPALNSGFFAALVETHALGAFAGHDHLNDFEGERFGVRLCYGRASGYSSYGLEGFARGARVIRLRAGSASFETWLRLEDGTRCVAEAVHEPLGRNAPDEQTADCARVSTRAEIPTDGGRSPDPLGSQADAPLRSSRGEVS